MNTNIAIIPARRGSKRIPNKNVQPFCGQPIIQYSIAAAIESNLFGRIVVSTDCEKIASLAIDAGAEVPFMRPAELADDHTPTLPVIRHAIEALDDQAETGSGATGATTENQIEGSTDRKFACCIYATAPLIKVSNLRAAFDRIQADNTIDFAFPVTTFAAPIQRSFGLDESGLISMLFPEHELTRSQDLPTAYHDVGQFYWGSISAWKNADGIFSARSIGVPIPREQVQDIDTPEDWKRAEMIFRG